VELVENELIHIENDPALSEVSIYHPYYSCFMCTYIRHLFLSAVVLYIFSFRQNIVELVENELIHIENDPALKHLLGDDEGAQAQA